MKTLALAAGLAAFMFALAPAKADTITTSGATTGTGPWHMTTIDSPFFSTVRVNFSAPITFSSWTDLSASFNSIQGGAGQGSPRFTLTLTDGIVTNTMNIAWGTSPNFNDTSASLNAGFNSLNVIGNNDAGRYDTSHFAGGSPFTTYSSAVALLGAYNVVSLRTIMDGPGQELNLSSMTANGVVYDQSSVQAVPAPIVGAGFPGLLAAAAGLIGLARRRRQKLA